MTDRISIRNIKNVISLDVAFEYNDSNVIVITGKNGIGKTTIIKSFNLLDDPSTFAKSSGNNSLKANSCVSISLNGFKPFTFFYNEKLSSLDSKDVLPPKKYVLAELPIPHGVRFKQFAKIAGFDGDLRGNIATSDYTNAGAIIEFLSKVYRSDKFIDLKSTTIKKNTFYFLLKENDYYIREDHFSSGEFFLIQLYRLISSGAKLILIDELDVALDAAAQSRLYVALKPVLQENNSRLIVVSHSLAFMSTVEEGGLYYLEENSGDISLERRSFGYIKSDLFGFKGFDRYILTEDETLEKFIEFVIANFFVRTYYKYIIIGLAGINQLKMIIEKNDRDDIFTNSKNVLCIVDGDVYSKLNNQYVGPTKTACSPVDDIEKYAYLNRDKLFPHMPLPHFDESSNPKKASKTYWNWLTRDRDIKVNDIFQLVVTHEPESVDKLLETIKGFLEV